jgi:hypothetical protein
MKIKILGANMTELLLDNKRILFSYETPVAMWIPGKGYYKTATNWSRKTSKHINKWLAGANAVSVQVLDIDAQH